MSNDKAFHLIQKKCEEINTDARKNCHECEDGDVHMQRKKKTAKNRTVRINQELTAMHQEVIKT